MRSPAEPRASTESAQRRATHRFSSRTLVLVLGDTLAFLIFATIGRGSHGEATGLGALSQVAWTAVPFALGWFLVAPFIGAYRRSATEPPIEMLKRTELAWVASWPVALLLRWALSADHQVPVSFAVVILIANVILLGGWRTAFALTIRRTKR